MKRGTCHRFACPLAYGPRSSSPYVPSLVCVWLRRAQYAGFFFKGLLRCHSHTVQLTHSKWTIQWLSNIQSCAPTVTGNFRAFITPKVSPIPFSAISPPQAPGSRSPASSLYRVVCSARFLHRLACHSVLCDWLPSRSRRFQVHLWVACISTSFLTMAE